MKHKKFLILVKSDLSTFSFVAHTSGDIAKDPLPSSGLGRFIPVFSPESFIVLDLLFGSEVVELIFTCV